MYRATSTLISAPILQLKIFVYTSRYKQGKFILFLEKRSIVLQCAEPSQCLVPNRSEAYRHLFVWETVEAELGKIDSLDGENEVSKAGYTEAGDW